MCVLINVVTGKSTPDALTILSNSLSRVGLSDALDAGSINRDESVRNVSGVRQPVEESAFMVFNTINPGIIFLHNFSHSNSFYLDRGIRYAVGKALYDQFGKHLYFQLHLAFSVVVKPFERSGRTTAQHELRPLGPNFAIHTISRRCDHGY